MYRYGIIYREVMHSEFEWRQCACKGIIEAFEDPAPQLLQACPFPIVSSDAIGDNVQNWFACRAFTQTITFPLKIKTGLPRFPPACTECRSLVETFASSSSISRCFQTSKLLFNRVDDEKAEKKYFYINILTNMLMTFPLQASLFSLRQSETRKWK